MPTYTLDGNSPVISSSAFIAPSASVIGRVALGENVSIWFGAMLYGDDDSITIGENSNVQDGAVLRTAIGQPVSIGRNVTVGHQAILEGCAIGEGSLVGSKAIVHYGAIVGKSCLIGAGAVIAEGESFPDGSLIVGDPGRFKRELTVGEFALLEESAVVYVKRRIAYKCEIATSQ